MPREQLVFSTWRGSEGGGGCGGGGGGGGGVYSAIRSDEDQKHMVLLNWTPDPRSGSQARCDNYCEKQLHAFASVRTAPWRHVQGFSWRLISYSVRLTGL